MLKIVLKVGVQLLLIVATPIARRLGHWAADQVSRWLYNKTATI